MIGIDSSPLLKVNRVVVTGELGCDIRLGNGLNIIKGESPGGDTTLSNDCGKTTFTELIKYGLGDRDRFTTGSIAPKINLLFLELSLNDQTITIRRDLNRPSARVGIFRNAYHHSFSSDEPEIMVNPQTPFSDFLLEELGIPRLRIPLSGKPGTQPSPITLQTFLRLWYMDQKNSFQEIMSKVQPDWLKGKVVQIMLGMAKEEVEQLKTRIQELTNNIDDLQREIHSVTEFLVSSGGANRVQLQDNLTGKNEQLGQLHSDIIEIKQRMIGDRGFTDTLRERIESTTAELSHLQETRAKAELKLGDFRSLLNSLQVDRDRIVKTKDAEYVLSTVDFMKCPRCLQRITSEMKHREVDGNCMLCSRPMTIREADTRILDSDEIVEEEISEVKLLIETYEKNIQRINQEFAALESKHRSDRIELDQRTSSFVSPFIDTLERLLSEAGEVESQIKVIENQLAQWDLVDRREEWLRNLREERSKIQSQVREIDTGDDTKIRKLSEHFEAFLLRVIDPEAKNARINPEDMMPLVNNRPYFEDVGSGWQSVRVIAYHYSVLMFSLTEPCYYPRFLMLDSPRAFDLNSKSYELLLLQFHLLQQKQSGSDFQVILTTRNVPEALEAYVVERLNNQNRMLLREADDREQSSVPH